MSKPVRTRKTSHKETLSDHIYKHSPIKRGTVLVKNEDKPYKHYNKIMNRIYLGNIQASKDKDFFHKKKIRAVLNCTKDIPNTFRSDESVEYMRIPIDDSLKEVDFEKALKFMPAAIEFIHKHVVLQKENVLIHCYAGRQRSAIMVAAYLVGKLGMSPKQACKYILEKRPEAFHFGLSLNFETSLEKYAKTISKSLKKCKK
jgi:protein-tyrosine phosphatase